MRDFTFPFSKAGPLMMWWFGVFLVLVLAMPSHAADEGTGGERAKEAPRATEPKKKQDADSKSDNAKPLAEDKAKEEKAKEKEEKGKEEKAAKEDKAKEKEEKAKEEKAKTEEAPPPKSEETIKKPVTSPNLAIKLALMADPQLFPFEIEVEMDKGKAVLSGAVPTEEEKGRAAEIAGKVEGVEAVVNKLNVVPTLRATLAKKQDEAIAHFVRDRLVRSETLKAVGFEVTSESGVVHLSGKTRFQVIALEAAEAARQVPGVRAVDTTGVQIIAKD
jgi:hyperosmotically inducible protein